MARILHISGDYPDPLAPAKTRAVSNLLAMIDGHEHRVVSINRVHWKTPPTALPFRDAAGDGHRALAYGAPGKGLMLRRFLAKASAWIEADCAADGYRPDLVHAHKLSIEGFAGQRLAAGFGVPLLLSIQGNTDQKIIGARRDLRPALGRIWRDAAVAFPFAPWAWKSMNALLGDRPGPAIALPCPTAADAILAPVATPPTIRTAFNLKDYGNKNLIALMRAVGRAAASAPDISLEVIGGGDPAAYAVAVRAAAELAPGRVRFLGAVPNTEMQGLLNGAAAFALVSHRETYGMVFAEALLAGAPCLIPHDRAIAGYFDEGSVVVSADPKSDAEIEAGLLRLVAEQAAFKARLAALGAAGGLDMLRRDAIKAAYLRGIDIALGAGGGDPPAILRLR